MLLVVLFFSGLCACSSANIPFFSAGWKNLKCWLKTQECFLNFAVIRNSIRSQYNIFWRNIQPNICICFMRIIISWTLIISRTAKREITRVHAGGRRRSGDLGPPRAVSTSQQRSFLNFFFFCFLLFILCQRWCFCFFFSPISPSAASVSSTVFLPIFFINKRPLSNHGSCWLSLSQSPKKTEILSVLHTPSAVTTDAPPLLIYLDFLSNVFTRPILILVIIQVFVLTSLYSELSLLNFT